MFEDVKTNPEGRQTSSFNLIAKGIKDPGLLRFVVEGYQVASRFDGGGFGIGPGQRFGEAIAVVGCWIQHIILSTGWKWRR
jgi:hypothetical protein